MIVLEPIQQEEDMPAPLDQVRSCGGMIYRKEFEARTGSAAVRLPHDPQRGGPHPHHRGRGLVRGAVLRAQAEDKLHFVDRMPYGRRSRRPSRRPASTTR